MIRFSKEWADRITAATRRIEASPITRGGTAADPVQLQDPAPVSFVNRSGEAIPPRAAVELADGQEVAGRWIFDGYKPGNVPDSETGFPEAWRIVFTRFREIPEDGLGQGLITYTNRARIETGQATPEEGQLNTGFGVFQDKWGLIEGGDGFLIIGDASEPGTVNVTRAPILDPNDFRPVGMEKTGGERGSATSKCTWTYTVTDPNTDAVLATDYDPENSLGGRWARHPAGPMEPATFGIGRVGFGGNLQVYFCNEILDTESC